MSTLIPVLLIAGLRTRAEARGAAELVRLIHEGAASINQGEVAVVIATAAHRRRFEVAMVERGVEALWNELLTVVPFSLFCAYPRRPMDVS